MPSLEIGATDWQPVVYALAAAIPGIVAAVISYLNRQNIRTTNGKTIGQMTEETHSTVNAVEQAIHTAESAAEARAQR